ncbi:MAG TPA: hypothetical protein VKZ41_04125 [Gemmatimonadales bacterium]|nr:hypothetical protein [Gemmatimonadales bacterium]
MPLFRGRQPASSVWKRFRSGVDAFTFTEDDGYFAAHVVANAERVVELFHALSEELPPAVDVAIDDVRTGRAWHGTHLALPDVRDAFARLKLLLTSHAGVEFCVHSEDDQLTLTPELELYIYARTDRWLYVLLGKGLMESNELPGAAWRLRAADLDPSLELQDALARAVEQLGLEEA